MTQIPSGWSKKNQKLLLVLKCDDFMHAIALLNSVADIAEQMQHHPDIAIRNYNELLVFTTTHSEKKLTDKDYELAKKVPDLIDYQAEKQNIEDNGR